ncbi:DUF397 domain-containing protein [Nocardiopsis potens]|uniref:DUF397 domain-containing protein n=1 Tax=Nocardiopsis potens TaxID=1246458 RepID=UPI00035FC21A|nr:DUF397 domain-containing protein [Nocardiopsis potens]
MPRTPDRPPAWEPGPWVRSSHSSAETGACVEFAAPRPRRGALLGGTGSAEPRVLLRDSRHPGLARLALPLGEWAALVRSVRGGAL